MAPVVRVYLIFGVLLFFLVSRYFEHTSHTHTLAHTHRTTHTSHTHTAEHCSCVVKHDQKGKFCLVFTQQHQVCFGQVHLAAKQREAEGAEEEEEEDKAVKI